MWLYFCAFTIFLVVLHLFLNYNARARMIKKLPGPKDDFIVGNAFRIICDPVELMKLGRTFAKKWNGIYRIWVYPFSAVVIYNPEDIEVVMSSMKYGEKSLVYKILQPWLQDGLLLSNGTKWQERRKILTPAFHFNILRQFCVIIEENTHRLIDQLQKAAGQPIDVVPILSEFTLNSICETAMGTQLNEHSTAKTYKKAIYDLGNIFYHRFIKIYLYPEFIFNATSLARKQNKAVKTVQSFTEKVIRKRREYVKEHGFDMFNQNVDDDEVYVYKKKKKTAMLDLLLSAEQEGLIDKTGVQEEVDTFMFEGHDTTASGLTFLFMLLANHPEIQDKVVNELNDIFGDSKRWACMDDLPKMKYLDRCIKESLRMYPPVHFISRKLNDETILSNHSIPAGTLCHIPMYDLHHREDLFPNPEVFDPDRFLPENSEGRHAYAYIPFSAGPRNCIGQKFAMLEMKIAAAAVLREFELKLVTKQSDIVFLADLVLRNNGPVQVKFVKRNL
uniref:Cytochrome p450 CYP4M17 n=1 Tax=Spodoptera exigua TaxID=7107 RepID=A0A248QEJ1_SPOEX|nr:cytochrome p450 CYP4M17 [Spodoptera exigua]